MPMILSSRKTRAAKRPRSRGKGKVSSRSLHGQGVQVSVDERVADLARRFPALRTTLGSLLSTMAAFLAADRAFRLWMMASSVIWIVHNIIAATPAAVILETFFLGSNVVAYYRFYVRDRR